jgi:hypothetical protein
MELMSMFLPRTRLKARTKPGLKSLDRKLETRPTERSSVVHGTKHRSIGNRKRLTHPLLKADVMGPEGPYGKYFEIKVTPKKFDLLKQFNFVRIIAGSVDFKLDKELLLKDIDTFLCSVPKYIPAVLLIMNKSEFEEKMNSLTVFRLNDGTRIRDYLLAHVTNRK